jgi:hypothetical protein
MRRKMWENVLESRTCRVCKGVEALALVHIQV